MSTGFQRTGPREANQTPIAFAVNQDDNYENTRIINASAKGLCIESKRPLAKNTHVYVCVRDQTPSPSPAARVGAIRWCEQIQNNGEPLYAIGVQLEDDPTDSFGFHHPRRHLCDLCGSAPPEDEPCPYEDGIDVCRKCHQHIQSIPEGLARQSIKRFMLGNYI